MSLGPQVSLEVGQPPVPPVADVVQPVGGIVRDYILGAADAVAYGLVDEVLQPRAAEAKAAAAAAGETHAGVLVGASHPGG